MIVVAPPVSPDEAALSSRRLASEESEEASVAFECDMSAADISAMLSRSVTLVLVAAFSRESLAVSAADTADGACGTAGVLGLPGFSSIERRASAADGGLTPTIPLLSGGAT